MSGRTLPRPFAMRQVASDEVEDGPPLSAMAFRARP